MNGNMQGKQLLISDIIKYAAINHAGLEIVGRRIEDSKVVRVTYGEIEERSRKVAQLLKRLGLGAGDCVASIAWNSARHVELYFGVSGSELILHTINPRLHHDQLVYLTDHAEDKVIFVDLNLVPLVESFFSGPQGQAQGRSLDRARLYARVFTRSTLLRRASRSGRRRLRMAVFLRGNRSRTLLHLRHDGKSQGRALQPPLDRAPQHGLGFRGRHRLGSND